MRFARRLVAVGAFGLAGMLPALADDPVGTWMVQDRKAKVRIAPCGPAMCGSIVWLAQPIDTTTGKPQTDRLNVDPAKRNRPVLGVAILLGMQRANGESRWSGKIYNPEDGNTYPGSIEFIDAARLKVRGCYAIFCQSEVWTRAN